jgi:hypothetical protein
LSFGLGLTLCSRSMRPQERDLDWSISNVQEAQAHTRRGPSHRDTSIKRDASLKKAWAQV